MVTVALHFDENGLLRVYSDEGVQVISVDDRSPGDRLYRYMHQPIPEGMLDGTIGHAHDGSPATARALRGLAEMQGRSHLSIVSEPEEPAQ